MKPIALICALLPTVALSGPAYDGPTFDGYVDDPSDQYDPWCGNDDGRGENCPECDDESGEYSPSSQDEADCEGSNKFSLYGGGGIRRVTDLRFWNTPGEGVFSWTRIAASRNLSVNPTYLGQGHNWTHCFDYTLSDAGLENGKQLLEIGTPSGYHATHRLENDLSFTPVSAWWRGGERLQSRTNPADPGVDVHTVDSRILKFDLRDDGQGLYFRLDSIEDKVGNLIAMSYTNPADPRELTRVTAPGGAYIDIAWTDESVAGGTLRVIDSVSSSDGRSATYSYLVKTDSRNSEEWLVLTGASYSDGSAASYNYIFPSAAGIHPLVNRATDTRSGSLRDIKYSYNGMPVGRIRKELNPVGGNVLADRLGGNDSYFIRISQGNGAKSYAYAPLGAGRVSDTYNSNGGQTTYEWGGYLNRWIRSVEDPDGSYTLFETRDNHGREKRTVHPDGLVTEREYDSRGRLKKLTEIPPVGSSRVTIWTRDALGRVTRLDHPDGSYETWTHNAFGSPLTHRRSSGATESWSYDASGRRTSHTGPEGELTQWSYDAAGRIASMTGPLGGSVAYQRDESGNVTREEWDDGSFKEHTYSANDDLLATTAHDGPSDPDPDTWSWTYDSFGRRATATDPAGHVTTWGYDDAGQGICGSCSASAKPTVVTTPEGRVTRYLYDGEWNVIAVVRGEGGPEAETTLTAYDLENRPWRVTSPDGAVTETAYDSRGRVLTRTVDADGLAFATTFTYDAFGNVATVTRPDSSVTATTHDAMDRPLTTTVSPDGGSTLHTTTRHYDSGGRLVRLTDPLSRDTLFAYDGSDRLVLTTHPDLTTTSATYDAAGNTLTTTNEMGEVVSRAYDSYGRNTSVVIDPGGLALVSATTHRPIALGGIDTATDASGRTVSRGYDKDGLVKTVTLASGTAEAATTTYTYDGDHLVTQVKDPVNATTTTAYDALGRAVAVTNPAGETTATAYLTAARQIVTTLPDGRIRVTTSDALGRTAAATEAHAPTDPSPKTTSFTYRFDSALQTSLTDAKGQTTTWAYDDLGRMIEKTYPGGVQKDLYQYDAAGRMTRQTRPSGIFAIHSYDLRDRVTTIDWNLASTPDAAYGYDAAGRMTSASQAAPGGPVADQTLVTRAYDAAGRMTSESQTLGSDTRSVSYSHDGAGRPTAIGYPSGGAVGYGWDARGGLVTVSSGAPPPLATYQRRDDGLVSRLTYESGAHTRYYYDAAKRSTGRWHHNPNGNFQDKNQYGYDSTGRRLWQAYGNNAGDRYGYDTGDQVTAADYNLAAVSGVGGSFAGHHQYVYDRAGNRGTFTVSAAGATAAVPQGTTSYSANALNQYVSITAPGIPPQGVWSYDPDGNLTGDGSRTFEWDAWNRLRIVRTGGALVATYLYDALGRRVRKTSAAEDIRFLYDGWNVIEERDASSLALVRRLTWGEDLGGTLQGAGGVGGLLCVEDLSSGGNVPSFLHYDANGNPARISTASGSWLGKYRYDAFGNLRELNGARAIANPWRFSTKRYDAETGFYYYGYRYYDPVTGRWPSRDPIEEIKSHGRPSDSEIIGEILMSMENVVSSQSNQVDKAKLRKYLIKINAVEEIKKKVIDGFRGSDDEPNLYSFAKNNGIGAIDYLGLSHTLADCHAQYKIDMSGCERIRRTRGWAAYIGCCMRADAEMAACVATAKETQKCCCVVGAGALVVGAAICPFDGPVGEVAAVGVFCTAIAQ